MLKALGRQPEKSRRPRRSSQKKPGIFRGEYSKRRRLPLRLRQRRRRRLRQRRRTRFRTRWSSTQPSDVRADHGARGKTGQGGQLPTRKSRSSFPRMCLTRNAARGSSRSAGTTTATDATLRYANVSRQETQQGLVGPTPAKCTADIGYPIGSDVDGSGWVGQPLIVQWPENIKQFMNMYDWAKQKAGLGRGHPCDHGRQRLFPRSGRRASRRGTSCLSACRLRAPARSIRADIRSCISVRAICMKIDAHEIARDDLFADRL